MSVKLSNVLKYSITALVGGGMALGVAFYCNENYGFFRTKSVRQIYAMLSDCFLIPSVLLIGIGLMAIISDEGFFDLFGFAFSNITFLFSRHKEERARETYYEYHERRKARREGKAKWHLVLVGLVFLIPCLIFMFIYFSKR